MIKLFTFLIGFSAAFTLVGQDLAFKTLATKGTCILQRGSNPDDYPVISAGVKVYENDKIIITGDQSYVGLVSTDGKLLEIKKGGVYNVSELKSGLVKSQSSLAKKYIEFLVNDMSKEDDATAKNMKFTGSVERDLKLGEESITLLLPAVTTITNEKAVIKWISKEPISEYRVTVKNLFEDEVFNKVTKENQMDLDFTGIEMNPEDAFLLVITDKSNSQKSSAVIELNVPVQEELSRLTKEIEDLKKANGGETALDNMVLATYFDQNGMYLNAIPYFQKAIEMEPDVKEYKTIYNRFLAKYNIPG